MPGRIQASRDHSNLANPKLFPLLSLAFSLEILLGKFLSLLLLSPNQYTFTVALHGTAWSFSLLRNISNYLLSKTSTCVTQSPPQTKTLWIQMRQLPYTLTQIRILGKNCIEVTFPSQHTISGSTWYVFF